MFYEKSVLKNFATFTGKHLHLRLFLIKLQATPFQQNPSGRLLLEYMYLRKFETKLFNLRILASLCNFNYLQGEVYSIVKFSSKISIMYHQKKIRKGIMKKSSMKMPFLKISQYLHKNACVGVSF